jgi:PhnB protein
MSTRLNPYIHFQGNAREAMESYQRALGGELVVSTFAEGGVPHDPADADKLMHAQLETMGGQTLMAADTPTGQPASPISGVSMSLSGEDDAELSRAFERLASDGGTVVEPLVEAPWGDKFGILTDRFGVTWFVNVTKGEASSA